MLSTWALAGLVRTSRAELAPPRYIGVTGPILLCLITATLVLTIERLRVTHNMKFELNRFYTVALFILLTTIAYSQLPVWFQARESASYLGSMNMARFSAMKTGRAWIDSEFAPPGEGLTYVRQEAIQEAWARRGEPELIPEVVLNREFPIATATAFVETLVAAGIAKVSSITDTSPADQCLKSLVIPTTTTEKFNFTNTEQLLTITLGYSNALEIPDTLGSGSVTLNPLEFADTWLISTKTGCLTAN